MTDEAPTQDPYVGPRPFEIRHQDRFFGRKGEVNEIMSLVIAERMVVIYAQSGAGKTSLINAGLVPKLEKEGFEIPAPARVGGAIPQGMALADLQNPYVFSILLSWAGEGADPGRLAQASLAGYLGEREHRTDEMGLLSPRAVILDQFEELFPSFPERWEDREGFFRQLACAMERDALLRVIFAIREDYLAQLDPYAPLLPGQLRTRIRLERLRQGAALKAVTGPLEGTGRSFDTGVAEQLVSDLLQVRVETATGEAEQVTGEFVEPVQLQVVCQSLWRRLPPDASTITGDYLRTFGDVDQALAEFYEEAIQAAFKQTGVDEGNLRQWCETRLITSTGTRGFVHRGSRSTEGLPNGAIDVLQGRHLVTAEPRAGARWYALTHDRFIEPIRRSNRSWWEHRTNEEWEKERKRLEKWEAQQLLANWIGFPLLFVGVPALAAVYARSEPGPFVFRKALGGVIEQFAGFWPLGPWLSGSLAKSLKSG